MGLKAHESMFLLLVGWLCKASPKTSPSIFIVYKMVSRVIRSDTG